MPAVQIDVNQLISNTLIAVTQNITQSTYASQLINVNCTTNQQDCNACIAFWVNRYKTANQSPDNDKIAENCKYICNCSLTDVDLTQTVKCNFKSFATVVTENNFFNSFKSNLYIQMNQTDSYIPAIDSSSNMDSIQKKVNSIHSALSSDTFQATLQSLQTTQSLSLDGPGSITAVSMSQMVDVVSNALQSNETVNTAINELRDELISMGLQVVNAGLNQLIASILMILAIIVIFIVLFFICQNVITLIPSLLL